MALRISRDLKNYVINQGIVHKMTGTMGSKGTCVIRLYTGSQPSDADIAPAGVNGTLLCQIINIGWGGVSGADSTVGATAGTASLASGAAGYMGTAEATGTVGWARMQTFGTSYNGSAATFNIDGDVGTSAASTFVINNVSVTNLGSVTLLTAPISIS